MSILDTTIVNVALETLSRELHADLATIQWVSTAYLLALATVIPLTGWAAERFGPKRVWMTVVTGFVVSSALCGLAWSAESLIAFRVLQGLAGGMVMPIGMITLAQTAGPQRMGRVMSVVGVPMLLAPVLGPVIGGFIVDNLSWRWIFYVNLPIGLVGLALAARLLPSGRAQGLDATTKLDWRGLVLLSPGVAMLVFGLSEVGSQGSVSARDRAGWSPGWPSSPPSSCAACASSGRSSTCGSSAGAGSAPPARRPSSSAWRSSARCSSCRCTSRSRAASRRCTPACSSRPRAWAPPSRCASAAAMTDRVGGGRVVLIGLTILTVATIPFGLIAAGTPYWLLALCVLARGVGLGFTMMPAMAAAYATLERSRCRARPRCSTSSSASAARSGRPCSPSSCSASSSGPSPAAAGASATSSPRPAGRRASASPSRSRRPSRTPTGGRSR